MNFLKVLRQWLIYLGYPWLLVLKIVARLLRKATQIRLPKFAPKYKVIYKAPRPKLTLKTFLKKIYPWVRLLHSWPRLSLSLSQVHIPRLPSLKWPKVNFKIKVPKNAWRFRFTLPKLRLNWMASIFAITVSISFMYFFVFKDLPSPTNLTTKTIPQTTHIRDRNGVELYKIYHDQNRTLVPLNAIPLTMRQATVAIEDAEFYSHVGFSLKGTMRAISRNFSSGQILEGGSTITQQLVKSSLLSPEKTVRRKLRELVLAIAVEWRYTKDEILEMYLNRVGYGGTAYGIEEAAQTYFGRSVTQLSLAQAALLAGLPASPTTYSPYGAHPELAKSRQKEVLRRMVDESFITWEQAETASQEELHFVPQATNIKAPHFVMYIKEILEKKYGTYVVEQGGLDVTTTLDWNLQQQAEKAVAEEVAKVARLRIGNGAAVVTNPQTGEILAMVGSKNYFDTTTDGNVNVALALRQPGSSIKPINYALSLMRGFTPASTIDDSPITYKVVGQPPYSPVNYDGKYHGKVSLRTALASSYNIPAVKLLSANGLDNMISLARKMGISTWNDPSRFGLSLTLGGGEVTMLDMATAYGVFANYGIRVDLNSILSIKNNSGKQLQVFACKNKTTSPLRAFEIVNCTEERVMDPKIAYLISDILSDNSARTPAFGPRSDLFIPSTQVAVKTGTTNNLRDNWTIGYTTDRLVAVWVGNNDNSSMSYVASGVTGASPIWRRIISEVLKTSPALGFAAPNGLVKVNVCTITGELACSGCPTRSEYFLPGTEPKKACSTENITRILEDKAKADAAHQNQILTGITTSTGSN